MTSNFGEIVELDSRSFVTDGEEWSLDKRYSIKTETEEPNEGKPCEYLLVASGKVISDFAAAFLINDSTQIVNRHHIVLRPKDRSFAKKKFTSTLYQLSNNTLLFVCEQLPHLYFTHHILVKIKPYIEVAGHTVVLSAEHMSSYKPGGLSQAFLRSLSTKACSLTKEAPNLELPNTVTGLPAAVLSWCQAKSKSAIVYVVYTEASTLDSITAEPVLELLKKSHFVDIPIPSVDKLKKVVTNAQLQNSNIYL